jgi:uncharacterized repeat protein (TIGR01451 family)
VAWMLAAVLGCFLGAAPAAAQPGVSIAMIGSPNMTLKHNEPCAVGSPRAMYVSYRITNTSGAPISNLSATISGFASGIALGGGQPATQFIGALPAGGARTLYWYVQYPCTFGVSATLTVAVASGGGPALTGSGTFTTRAMQATGTGGQLQSALLGAGAVVGQTISLDVEYTFGNTQVGDEFDHQPAGNTNFNAACFQLVGTLVVSSQALGVPAGTVNRTYFVSTVSQGGSGHAVVVRYFFKYLCAGVTSPNRPYANQTSGATNLKYSSNFDTFVGPTLPIATNPFSVTKTASPTQLPAGGTVTYTVVVTNPSAFTAEADSIVDVLPPGVSFQGFAAGSQVTAANSGSVPAPAATGRIAFRGNPGTSYVLPAGGTLTIIYTATVTANPGRYVNTASGFAGITGIGSDTALVTVGSADVTVAKVGPASVVVGDTAAFVITTANAGPHAAFDVVVRDDLPAGSTFVGATRGATVSGGVVTWPAVAELAAGAAVVDTVWVQVPAALGAIENVASSTADTHDPAPGNNDGSDPASRALVEVVGPIEVTPKGLPAPLLRLPGTGYAQPFEVTHRAGAAASFDLLAATGGAPPFVVVDSLTGPGIGAAALDSARVVLPARTSVTYTLWYTVPPGDTATTRELLHARAAADPALADSGWVEVRRVFPALALTRSVSPTSGIGPGVELTYELNVRNAGHFAADGVTITEAVAAQVAFKVGSTDAVLPAGLGASVEYSDDGGSTWTYTPVSGGCGAPADHDGCVQRIRWILSAPLSNDADARDGTLRFLARVR